jgi:tetratricopeptide (TPR) repeat protein
MYDRVRLAGLLLESGENEKALEASLTVEKEALLLLGPYHDTSRSAKRIVVEALDATGQLELAVETREELIRTEEQCLDADHGVLIESLAVLGVQYYRLGMLESARTCYDKVIASVARKTDNVLPAVVSINNYAARRFRHDGVEESVTILQHLLKEAQEVLGPDRKEVVAVIGNLAAAYQKQKKWADAEPLERRVLEYRCRVFGEKHHHTLSAFGNLARNLMHQRKWADAAAINKRALQIRDTIPETTDTTRIALLSAAGKALTLSEAYAEAVDLFDRLFPLAEQQQKQRETLQASGDGKAPLLYIQDIALAVLCRAKLGLRSPTRRQLSVLLDALQSPWREVPDVLIDNLTFVAKACDEQNWDEETEQALAAAALLVDKYGEHICAPVRNKLLVETSSFLEKKGKEELYFYPASLESTEL